MGVTRAGTLALYLFLAATGALADPGLTVVCGTVSALAGAAVVAALVRHASADLPRPAHPAVAAAVAGGSPAALAGAAALGPSGGLLLVLLLTLATGLFGHWIGSDAPASTNHRDPSLDS